MRYLPLCLGLLLWLPSQSRAVSWVENDYDSGSNGMKKESLTFFTGVSQNLVAGANAAFYRNNTDNRDMDYSFRLPLMYTAQNAFITFTPFIYPESAQLHSQAAGGKLSVLTSFTKPEEDNYLHFTVAGSWAQQDAGLLNSAVKKTFSESALELKLEKSFYDQFILMASAAGFSDPSGVSNKTLVTPSLDQSDMADFGTFSRVSMLPEWVLTAQMARSMKPEYDSYLYAGYSKISFRHAAVANSVVLGIKMGITEQATMDFVYNPYKLETSSWKNYYKVLFDFYFDSPGKK